MGTSWDTNSSEKPWYSSFSSCLSSCVEGKATNTIKKPSISVVRKQPQFEANPTYHYEQNPIHATTWGGESQYRRSRTPEPYQRSRSFSPASKARRNRIRRSQISGPTDFRHVAHEMIDLPGEAVARDDTPTPIQRPRRASYRPLELSIFLPNNNLSPLWPHFGLSIPQHEEEPVLAPPPAAVLADARDDAYLFNQRSDSATSTHLLRRSNSESCSRTGSARSQYSGRTRPTTTVPDVSSLVQRIASAMIDLEQLQDRIEQVSERQSVYMGGQSFGLSLLQQSLNRLPSIPDLPGGDGPSFSQRMRPQTTLIAPKRSRPQTMTLSQPKRPQTMMAHPELDVPLSAVSERRESFDSPHRNANSDRPSSDFSFVSALSERPESIMSNHSLASGRSESVTSLHFDVSELRQSTASGWRGSFAVGAPRPQSIAEESEFEYEVESEAEDEFGSEQPTTATMAVMGRPKAVMTKRKWPTSTAPKQRSRTIISSKRPITLLTPARAGTDDAGKKAVRPASSGAALGPKKEWTSSMSPSSVAVEVMSLPKTPVVPAMQPTYPTLRKKQSVSTLNWHLFPQTQSQPQSSRPLTMGPPPPRAGRGREGMYSYMAPRKDSFRSSMDSLSSSLTMTTTDSEDMPRPEAVVEERLSYISAADDSDVYVGVNAAGEVESGDLVNLSVPMEAAGSKHVSFNFGLLSREPITMTFDPQDSKRVSAMSNVEHDDGPIAIENGVAVYQGVSFGIEPGRKSVGVAY